MMHIPSLYIAPSEKRGNGVFSAADIQEDDLIEICPILIIPKEQVEIIHSTILHDYYFIHPVQEGAIYIALGYGSMYNHQNPPNAEVVFDEDANQMQIHCTNNIKAGEEIFINYNGDSKAGVKIWFEEI